VPKKSYLYIRLYPVHAISPIESELAAYKMVSEGGLKPVGIELAGYSPARNSFGAIVFAACPTENVYNFSQLFVSGEIIGIDLKCTHDARSKGQDGRSGIVSIDEVERASLGAFINFANFYKTVSQVPLPWRLECGLYGVRDFALFSGTRTFGNILRDSISWAADIDQADYTIDILRPFFETGWEAAGAVRERALDARLAHYFRL
jgi:hypothetical protein